MFWHMVCHKLHPNPCITNVIPLNCSFVSLCNARCVSQIAVAVAAVVVVVVADINLSVD